MIVIAPTAFKGTVSAAAAAHAMAAGARAVTSMPLHVQPLSDGGPGLIDAFSVLGDVVLHHTRVRGPSGAAVDARILIYRRMAIVESADACGWHLVTEAERDVSKLNTWGVGELIRAAAKHDVDHIIVGLGGSATIDAGIGMKQALANGAVRVPIVALADVDTPLLQAAPVFGPQKGATPQQIGILQEAFGKLISQTGVPDFPGAGAAGGLGYGLRVFANAQILRGSDWVLETTGLLALLPTATVIVTGEGRFDEQSFMGKITGTLVGWAQAHDIPILVISGSDGVILREADMERAVRERLPALLPT